MKAITQQWLEYAEADLKCCENNIGDEFLTNIVAFHSQQTVEKCFKAIIEENGLKLERVHNLFKLYSKIETEINFEIDIEKLELLDKVYTTSRYPGEVGLMPFGKPNTDEVTEMYEFAKIIFEKTGAMFAG
jgi:HEPN domain-containing protein